MSSPSSKYQYSLATAADGKDLLALYESDPFTGAISLLYTRRPNPYTSFSREGDRIILPIMRDTTNGRLCGAGCCVLRKAYVNGVIKNTAYLTGLKIAPDYQRRIPYIANVYQKMFSLTEAEVDLYYTTILKENIPAQKLLEKRRRGMPEYRCICDYTVFCFIPPKMRRDPIYSLEKGNVSGLESFYEERLKHYNLSPPGVHIYGLQPQAFYTLRRGGRIVAACVLWDQRDWKQYIIKGYRGLFNILKHLPVRWLGYPDLPKENTIANYASVTMCFVEHNDLKLASYFLSQVAKRESRYDFFLFGLTHQHPLQGLFQRIKHVKYQSKLYTVHNTEEAGEVLDHRPINLEVGLL